MRQSHTTKARGAFDSARLGSAAYPLGMLGIVLVTIAVYWPALHGAFIFDDADCIIGNPGIRSLDLGNFVSGTLRVRPVAYFTFAVSYAFSDARNPFRDSIQFHIFNIAVHILASLLLCGIVRRTLLGENGDWLAPAGVRRDGFRGVAVASAAKPVPVPIFEPPVATGLSLLIAVLWAVHPLNTGAVSYVIQREESLMGMFFLLALYAVIRGHRSSSPGAWYVLAVVACVLGAGTKQVIAVAPLVIAIYDRVFLSTGWREVLRRRGLAYAGMVVGIGGMLALSFAGMQGNPTVGFGSELVPTSLEYALTQPGVILRYLSLSFWPAGQVLDYMWPVARGWEQIVPQTAAIIAMLGATVWALWRRPAWGFIGVWFFIILGPSSSFMPIRDPAFEHRMYLPLAAVIAGAVIGAYVLARQIGHRLGGPRQIGWACGIVIGLGAVVTLAVTAGVRNQTYQSALSMWRDVAAKRPDNYRAFNSVGTALLVEAQSISKDDPKGDAILNEAVVVLRRSIAIKPDHATALSNLGSALLDLKQYAEAESCLLRAIDAGKERERQFGTVFFAPHANYANLLMAQDRWPEAETQWRIASDKSPDDMRFRYNLGLVIKKQGRYKEALVIFESLYKATQWPAVLEEISQCRDKLPAN